MSILTDTLRGWLKFSPQDPGLIAPGFMGRETDAGDFVCATCTGRLAARKIRLPVDWKVVWKDQVHSTLTCATCDDVFDQDGDKIPDDMSLREVDDQ